MMGARRWSFKEIIDGKLYNTDTSQEIAYDHKNHPHGWSETLYRTKKGAWFFVRNAEYTISLIPLTAGEALRWLEQHASADQYIHTTLEHFGSKVEEA